MKGKRKVVRRVVDRTRHQFNAAVAEVADQDVLRRAVIGVTVVSNDGRHADSMLSRIGAFVEGLTEAVVVDRTAELIHVGGGLSGADDGPLDGEGWV